MIVEFWVEEPSMAAFLDSILPAAFERRASYYINDFGDKGSLLRDAPASLSAHARWMPEEYRIVVLVDRDDDDCRVLKARLESMAQKAGLRTRASEPERLQVLNRVVVEELEAWLFGDPQALRAAYPRLSGTFELTEPFRDPDAIAGGTWEALERLLQGAGHLKGRLRKRETAEAVARHMVPERNSSGSFQTFWTALTEMLSGA